MKRTTYFILGFFVLTVLLPAQHFPQPRIFGDAYTGNGVTLQWKFKTEGAVRSTPVTDGFKLFVGSSDGYLYCLDRSNGKQIWRFNAYSPISSSPAVSGNIVFFTSRKNVLFAINSLNGTLKWKKDLGTPLPYQWGFDYYLSSPVIENNTVYIGSANGNIFALNDRNGAERWHFKTYSMVRSTPTIDKSMIYCGDCSGKFYAIDRTNGSLRWQFSTVGDTLDNEQFGFDRKAVISTASADKDNVFFGGRDGFLYALDKQSGKERWRYDYHVSWIISTAAISDSFLVTGTSDGRFVHALNRITGKEIWRFNTNGPVWASPSITGNNVILIPGNDGFLYALKRDTGEEIWRYNIGQQIFSSPFPVDRSMYLGSDDGYVYALITTDTAEKPAASIKRAVFWMKDPVFQPFRKGMDVFIRDYFIREGYDFYDETDIKDFLLKRIHSDTASVIVFATNILIPEITRDTLGSNVFRAYLQSGGRAVFVGLNPSVYQIDFEKRQFTGLDFSLSEKITGIQYRFKDLRSHGGFYSSMITEEGNRWGLKRNFVGVAGMPVEDIDIPLALDENGRATAWVKHFSTDKYSGFVQLYLTPDKLDELPNIQKTAEYGLRSIH